VKCANKKTRLYYFVVNCLLGYLTGKEILFYAFCGVKENVVDIPNCRNVVQEKEL